MQELHVIFGTGPVGCWTARALRNMDIPVRAVNRSGHRPALMPADVDIRAADVSDSDQAIRAAEGAAVIYQALNPPYHRWHALFPGLQAGALEAARAAEARYVSIENLYMYAASQAITIDSPVHPVSQKGRLRQAMAEEVIAVHEQGELLTTALRASDYFGPGVTGSAAGEMVFGNLVKGKKAQLNGAADVPHSLAFIEDVGKAAAVLGTSDDSWGRAWIAPHAPPLTQAGWVDLAGRFLGSESQYTVISPFMMRLAGLFIPEARASVEMMYEFTQAFIVESNMTGEPFHLNPTPAEEAIRKTIRWYKDVFSAQP